MPDIDALYTRPTPTESNPRKDDGTDSDIKHEGLVSDSVAPTLDGTIPVDVLKSVLAESTRGITANFDAKFQMFSSEFQRVDQIAKEAIKIA